MQKSPTLQKMIQLYLDLELLFLFSNDRIKIPLHLNLHTQKE